MLYRLFNREKKNKSKGIGTYAVNLAIKKCFEFYKMSEIYSLSQTSNKPSCKLLKKIISYHLIQDQNILKNT